jgi:hypothetical protein
MKKCNICKVEKEQSLFKKDNRRPGGYGSSCKECLRIKGLEYYYRTKDIRNEDINKNRLKYYQNNKEVENLKSKEYKRINSDKIKEYNKEYRENNKEKITDIKKKYRENNKEKINEYQRFYFDKRLKNDIIFKISHYYRNMIRKSFNGSGFKKESKTSEILGCSFEEFKIYLESKFEDWMTWENRGLYNGELNYGWDIDHIIPVSSAKTEEDLIKLNHYKNLQPLCSKINRDIKRDSI